MDDHRKTKAQLVQEVKELRARVAAMAPQLAGTWVIDADFVVRVADQTMCRLLQKNATEVVGRKCYDLLDGPSCHSEACVLRQAFSKASGDVEALRTTVQQVPGSCRIMASFIMNRDKEHVGVVQQVNHDTLPTCKPRHPRLRKVRSWRVAYLVCSQESDCSTQWSKTFRQAGFAVECQQATACLPPTRCPDVAVLDLDSLGRTSDAVHQKIRNACPQTPIIVVCSKDDALEARRWKRTATWFVPKAVGADGILRLLEELQPKVGTARRKRSE